MSDKINMKERVKKLLQSAKARNIEVDLKVRLWEDLIKLGCNYCGSDISDEKGYCLDRFDNEKGYTNENIAVCCKICNYAKRAMDAHDFYDWVERAYKHQQKHLNAMAAKQFTFFEEDFVRHNIKLKVEHRKKFNKYLHSRRMANSEEIKYTPN
jgi:hypothetical protein